VSDLQHLPHGHLLHFLSPTNQASVAAYLTLLQARQYAPRSLEQIISSLNPTATFLFDVRVATGYAAPVYPIPSL
jgi:hypothetical protein